ncbi:MAG: hypothetical protein IKI03_05080 [Clostridia bacterium]|nr:hypothetical protein [Clostridia bacterium]
MKETFVSPGPEFRPAPFWSWNSIMDECEVRRQVADFAEHGFGGAFAHARQGLVTEYLSDDFFRAWAAALDESKKHGAFLYMYDENCWPSGFAGGLTVEVGGKELIGDIAKTRFVDASDPSFGGELLFAAQCEKDFVLGEDLTDVAPEEWGSRAKRVMVIYRLSPYSGGCGGYPYVDLTNRKTTDTFLKVTYEEYYKRFGADFGGAIPAVFSDEANIHSEGTNTVPYNPQVIAKYREISGFELKDCIPAVFRNVSFADGVYRLPAPAEKLRHDYYLTLHTLWIENFVRPVADWCEEHRIAWTGHDIEHQWPQAHGGRILPSEQNTYEYRQWPGLDLLLCDHLRDYPTEFDKLEMIEIRSAANQFSKERTLCEAYGAGGYQSTVDDYKRMGDYLLVNGINFLVPHLSLFSYMGLRKRDCPQSFDSHQPWWREWADYNDYLARGSFMLTRGKMEQRILYLNPSTTSYLVPGEEAEGIIDHRTDPGGINPDMSDFLELFEGMCVEGWDFDLGDEFSIRDNASVAGGRLKVGAMEYETVVVSKNMKNMLSSTARLLSEFMRAGGSVLSTGDGADGDAGGYIDGETGTSATAEIRSAWTSLGSPEAVLDALSERFEKHAYYDPLPGVASTCRRLDDGGETFFIVNHAMGDYSTRVSLKAKTVARWNMATGGVEGVEVEEEKNGYVSFPLTLERCESALFVTDGEPLPAPEKIAADRDVPLTFVSAIPERDNAFTLDHPSLTVGGETFPPRYFIETCDTLFDKMLGKRNIWQSMQRGTEFLDLNGTFGEDTAFELNYKFEVAPETVGLPIRAAYERPDVMRLSVNGREIPRSGEKWLLGPEFGVSDITEAIESGENVLTLRAERFDVLCEVEAVFLEGDFSVGVEDGRFILNPGRTPEYGPWTKQGMSHYPGAVLYEFSFDLENVPGKAVFSAPAYSATGASITVNGEYAGAFGINGRRSADVAKYLREGENSVVLRICGSFQNLLGPHLNYSEYIPYDWSPFERGREAGAEEYKFFDWGLYGHPTLEVSEQRETPRHIAQND